MIEVIGVSKHYAGTPVLQDVSFGLHKGGITSIVGPNGAGKSTLLSLISRLNSPDQGRILVDSLDVAQAPGEVLARRLSILRQDNHIMSRLRVRELVSLGRYPHSKGRMTLEDREHVEQALAFLNLQPLAERFLDELSGGQRQRAFVAMVLCQDTDYVLLDEPLNNLDMQHSVAMMQQIRRAADELGKTVMLVNHDINFASAYSDRIIAMQGGRIIHDGTPEQIMQPATLEAIFRTPVMVEQVAGQRIAIYYRQPGF